MLAAAVLLAGCGEPKPIDQGFYVRDTTGTVWVAAQSKSMIYDATELAESSIRRSFKITDVTDSDSQFSQINRVANLSQVPLSADAFRIIDLAYYYTDLTEGTYDITTAPLVYLWGFQGSTVPAEIPSQELINAVKASMGRDHAVLSATRSMAFTTPLTRIDLGEVAEGYAVDLTILQYRRNKISNAMVIYGDTARCEGAKSKLLPWDFTINDPFTNGAPALGRVSMPEAFAVHSASLYKRYVVIGDKKYGHIIDPRTGFPVEDTISVTVLGPTATQAAALAQSLMVLGLEKGTAILSRFPRHDVMIVPNRQPPELWMTKGFAIRFKAHPEFKGTIHLIEPPATESAPSNAVPEITQ